MKSDRMWENALSAKALKTKRNQKRKQCFKGFGEPIKKFQAVNNLCFQWLFICFHSENISFVSENWLLLGEIALTWERQRFYRLSYRSDIIGTIETTCSFWNSEAYESPRKNNNTSFRDFAKRIQKIIAIEKHGFSGFCVPMKNIGFMCEKQAAASKRSNDIRNTTVLASFRL